VRWAAALVLAAAAWGPAVAGTPPRKGSDEAPKVISKAAADASASKTGSEFLRPPGADRYDPDGADGLPWRQASFFGIRARGQFFVYVVDCSGSMIDEDRLVRAKAELRRSVMALQPPQRFKVIFYSDRIWPMPGDMPRPADVGPKLQMIEWLRLIEPDGGTDPRAAMSLALSLQPDAVFLLSDGEFPEGTVESIARRNPRKIPIHCVDLSGADGGGDHLRRIAADSGGQYRWRPPLGDASQ
jgi:hypothetical protein